MRALILSDTHGYVGKLQDALYDAGDCDAIVHLGDGVRDLPRCAVTSMRTCSPSAATTICSRATYPTRAW